MNSLDPSRGCALQAELIVTNSLETSGSDSETVPVQWESVVAGDSPLFHNFTVSRLSRGQLVCFERFVQAAKTNWKFLDFSITRSLFEAILSQDVAKEKS